ncbi:hypothetical protein [Aliagarivorans taiwanensis]|uniref:hypothetical protein n=1 Tax=Aliagarivorans taiwanensis TaxID=561966 RepID=UPI0004148E15|nr:hypothetical protein [Aliagarivorans taiwanensis]
MGIDYYSLLALIEDAETSVEAAQFINEKAGENTVAWFNHAELPSYEGLSPREVLEDYGIAELTSYLNCKAMGGFE